MDQSPNETHKKCNLYLRYIGVSMTNRYILSSIGRQRGPKEAYKEAYIRGQVGRDKKRGFWAGCSGDAGKWWV